MATKTTRVCDIFETARGVERYLVTVERLDDAGEAQAVFQAERDMSLKALERAIGFIRRGLSQPGGPTTSEPEPPGE